MTNLKNRIKEARIELGEKMKRRDFFIDEFIETGDKLYFDLMEDENRAISSLILAIRKAEEKIETEKRIEEQERLGEGEI